MSWIIAAKPLLEVAAAGGGVGANIVVDGANVVVGGTVVGMVVDVVVATVVAGTVVDTVAATVVVAGARRPAELVRSAPDWG